VCRQPIGDDGYAALYAEVSFADADASPFSLSTTVCIAASRDQSAEADRCHEAPVDARAGQ
jgi:hypothetical protein